ncbi:MAG: lipoprotein-releasing ABC transporter permease subunit [Gammaproteobacteria bacterium]
MTSPRTKGLSRSRYEYFIGLRYIRSHGGNRFISFISMISMLGIALGVAVLIVVLSVMNGFEEELRSRILSMTAHATVSGGEQGLVDWESAIDLVEQDPRVRSAAPFIEGEAMLVGADQVSGVLVRGIVPEREREVSAVADLLEQGSLADLQAGSYRIVLGSDLAEHLETQVGDTVIMVVPLSRVTPAGVFPRWRRFRVSGIFHAGMYEYDRNQAFIHMRDAARLYELGERVSGVRLSIVDPLIAPEVIRDVAPRLDGAMYIADWTRSHANFFRSIQITKSMMFAMLLLIMGVAAFNIVSTLVMVVRDKQGDISILRTMGARSLSVMKVFMVQGILIGVMGTLGGLLLGVLIAVNLESLIHAVETLLETDLLAADVYFIGDLPARVHLADLLKICTTALGLSFLSTLYPAWRAARIQPAEVLRYE